MRIAGCFGTKAATLLGLLCSATLVAAMAPPSAAPAPPTLPWAKARAMAEAHFTQLALQPNDLISRSEAASLLAALKKSGWTVAGSQELLARIPADNSFMVQTLRRPDALNFMRHVGGYPDGYDRVDRMSRMPRGEIILRDLVTNPGGYQLIQYMTESRGGLNFGKQLANGPSGKNFNQPTGRIYTWSALVSELGALYDEAQQPLPRPARVYD